MPKFKRKKTKVIDVVNNKVDKTLTVKQVWVDGFEANVPQRLGSSQVAFELLKQLEKQDQLNNYTILLASPPLADLPPERPGWQYQLLKPNKALIYLAIPWHWLKAKIKPDLFLSLSHYSPRFIPTRRIVTIFDLSPLRFPEYFLKKDLYKLTNWTAYSVKKATKIITISQASKKDIQHFYKTPSDKITVAYPGYDQTVFKPIKQKSDIKAIQQKYQIEGDYLIYIGTLQPRKNIERLIEAVARIPKLKLVVVGKTKGLGRQGWMFERILAKPAELGIEDRVIFTGFVPTDELPYLIAGAKAYCLVSLWEGFGIPVLEAMACGVPAIVSNVSSLPEVVGEGGLMVNPTSVDQIEMAIRSLVTDQKLHDRLAKKALAQAETFSWPKMARAVLKILNSV